MAHHRIQIGALDRVSKKGRPLYQAAVWLGRLGLQILVTRH